MVTNIYLSVCASVKRIRSFCSAFSSAWPEKVRSIAHRKWRYTTIRQNRSELTGEKMKSSQRHWCRFMDKPKRRTAKKIKSQKGYSIVFLSLVTTCRLRLPWDRMGRRRTTRFYFEEKQIVMGMVTRTMLLHLLFSCFWIGNIF